MLRLPIIQGVIDRRLLVNFRSDPHALRRLLPAPFRPKLVGGYGIAGVCLIRLRQIRPRGFPVLLGVGSENAAHRIAVEWTDEAGAVREGVFISRRDSSSRLNHLLGGRLFPGVHHHARFDVHEANGQLSVAFTSDDGSTRVCVEGRAVETLPPGSVFRSVQQASEFFRGGSIGFSPRWGEGLDGLELRTQDWVVAPLEVSTVESSFFDDRSLFPAGSATFDNALLMRDIIHEWHAHAAPVG